jgi:hypothetical protein
MASWRRYRPIIALAGLWLIACHSEFKFDPPKTPALDGDAVPDGDAGPQPPEMDAAPADDAAQDAPAWDEGVMLPATDTRVASDARRDAVAAEAPADGPQIPALCGTDPGCTCQSNVCNCGLNQSCDFTGIGCAPTTGSCTLYCHNRNSCTGSCQQGCIIQCYGGSTCNLMAGASASVEAEGTGTIATVTVGAGSNVKCEGGATCFFTCTSSCTMECEGASCYLGCGTAAARLVPTGGSCP